MNKVKSSGHDTDDVMELLEANTYFISSRTKETCRQVLRILHNDVEELKMLWAAKTFESLMFQLASEKNKQRNVSESEFHLRRRHGLPTGLSIGLDSLLLTSLSLLHEFLSLQVVLVADCGPVDPCDLTVGTQHALNISVCFDTL
ncbi:hypothetical protein CHS0354_007088 [Potamilus streckersoni]|uniref:Uncharacterized protein n=1 Tax=Potamilus streckersoni TaxID=2493646 RepID=A0AAE0SMK5_9BIVA|nr:hypothetical protein CHS0354_007088 [Potamilus streckersoni]